MQSRGPNSVSRPKRWGFRLLAILLSVTPLVFVEGLLRMTQLGLPSEVDDPFVGFDQVRPLFVLDRDQQNYITDPSRLGYFRPESFAAEKPADEFRIFCMGGSTVQGRPYAIETSFTTWLELSLEQADPTRRWEVVNVGGVSYASYRLVPILRELLEHEPDLFVLYTGHNEFLEDRTYRNVKETAGVVRLAHGWSSYSRLYNLCRSGWLHFGTGELRDQPQPQEVLPKEVDAILDYYDGLADYHRDDAWRAGAASHYAFNVSRMINLARAADVPLILVNPVVNLRDCPPFKVEPAEHLTDQQTSQFEELWEQALQTKDVARRTQLLEHATAIDGRMAAAQFALAKCYEAAGRFAEAKTAFINSKDEDICPLRMIEPQYQALREISRRTATPLVDARALFEIKSRDGIPGDDWLLDHVHPSINGHQEISQLLLAEMVEMGLVQPLPGWESHRQERFVAHLESLKDAYFVHGQQRLEGLLMWTKGRAEGRGRRKPVNPTATGTIDEL